jgi:hypothetical protein
MLVAAAGLEIQHQVLAVLVVAVLVAVTVQQ